jgi:hypothetical protein
MKSQESSIIGIVDGPLEVRWDEDGSPVGALSIPTKVRDRKVIIEAPLRRITVGSGELTIGVGVNFLDVDQGQCLRATGRLSAQPVRIVVGRIDTLRRADTTRSGLYLQGVLKSYDRFGVGRVELSDSSVVKVEFPLGITVGVGETIGARGFPAKQPNTLRLVDVVIIAGG